MQHSCGKFCILCTKMTIPYPVSERHTFDLRHQFALKISNFQYAHERIMAILYSFGILVQTYVNNQKFGAWLTTWNT